MFVNDAIWLAQNENPVYLLPRMANRHGLIAGATGTGKTVTLKVLAESFSDMGVPVFLADVKGDLSGMAAKGVDSPAIQERLSKLGIKSFEFKSFPVRFWDIYGENGHSLRTTISEMGSLLLSRLLNLNETQSGILNIAFRIADEQGLLLLDLKDLREMIRYVGDNAREFTMRYGNISPQSIGAIMRSLIALEDQGGDLFFGEPALDIRDWMQKTPDGRGYINILHSVRLFNSPLLYSTFLLWMLSELFETLPEAGDLEKPKLVFFFDEAHLLFEDAPKILVNKIEQVVRLIRSKGVGIFFITQNPADLPQDVLGQLGNKIQHALRAYTPSEQKKVKAAADAFRPNPEFSTEEVITNLATGEALISCLDADGRPSVVQRAYILPPQSSFGVLDELTRRGIINNSSLGEKYDTAIDRESAYEILQARSLKEQERIRKEKELGQKGKQQRKSPGRPKTSVIEKAANSAVTTIGRELGRTLIRGILGSLKK
ncbi:MAG: DUF853 family protein [Clostridiaceae bacterium]|nr:DUF853 family protein [Clostridiaceae bacterium]